MARRDASSNGKLGFAAEGNCSRSPTLGQWAICCWHKTGECTSSKQWGPPACHHHGMFLQPSGSLTGNVPRTVALTHFVLRKRGPMLLGVHNISTRKWDRVRAAFSDSDESFVRESTAAALAPGSRDRNDTTIWLIWSQPLYLVDSSLRQATHVTGHSARFALIQDDPNDIERIDMVIGENSRDFITVDLPVSGSSRHTPLPGAEEPRHGLPAQSNSGTSASARDFPPAGNPQYGTETIQNSHPRQRGDRQSSPTVRGIQLSQQFIFMPQQAPTPQPAPQTQPQDAVQRGNQRSATLVIRVIIPLIIVVIALLSIFIFVLLKPDTLAREKQNASGWKFLV